MSHLKKIAISLLSGMIVIGIFCLGLYLWVNFLLLFVTGKDIMPITAMVIISGLFGALVNGASDNWIPNKFVELFEFIKGLRT